MVFDVEMVNDSQTGPQTGVAHKDHRKTKKILLELERVRNESGFFVIERFIIFFFFFFGLALSFDDGSGRGGT